MSSRKIMPPGRRGAKTNNEEGSPRYHVLSLRVSDEEKQELKKLLTPDCPNLSEMMRQALEHWKAEMVSQGTADAKAVSKDPL